MKKQRQIDSNYIAGFVDGEGCFSLTFRNDKGKYYYWKASFAIVLRKDDKELLNKIKNFWGCGNVSLAGKCARYQISDCKLLKDIIIPFFEKYSLIGKKRNDFNLWREAVLLINKNKKVTVNVQIGSKGFVKNEWKAKDLKRLKEIRNLMKNYKGGGANRLFKH